MAFRDKLQKLKLEVDRLEEMQAYMEHKNRLEARIAALKPKSKFRQFMEYLSKRYAGSHIEKRKTSYDWLTGKQK